MIGKISEVFQSIQGEGLYVGARQIFVRFFGCNLNCKFCDTKLSEYEEFQPDELLHTIKKFGNHYHSVSFTGGEPLLQKDFLKEILKLTRQAGLKNYLETNGTLPEALSEVLGYVDIVAMDIKLPSSTGLDNFWQAHRGFLKMASAKEVFLKSVVCESTRQEDLEEAVRLIKEINPAAILVLQPNSFQENAKLTEKLERFRDFCEKEDIVTCIIPQMHKILGVK